MGLEEFRNHFSVKGLPCRHLRDNTACVFSASHLQELGVQWSGFCTSQSLKSYSRAVFVMCCFCAILRVNEEVNLCLSCLEFLEDALKVSG